MNQPSINEVLQNLKDEFDHFTQQDATFIFVTMKLEVVELAIVLYSVDLPTYRDG